jgi:hypothetical protein
MQVWLIDEKQNLNFITHYLNGPGIGDVDDYCGQ